VLEISQAAVADLPQLVELLGLLFAQEADFAPDAARQEAGLRLILGRPEVGSVYCARSQGTVVGMVSLLFTVSTARGGRAAWLEDLVVRPGERGRGVGGRLLRHAIADARALGCTRITLLTDDANEGAQRFYERAGFVRSAMVPLRLDL